MIKRHEIKNPQMAGISRDSEHNTLRKGLPVIISDPTSLGRKRNDEHRNAAIAIALDLGKNEAMKDLTYAAKFGVAFWKFAAEVEDEITLEIEGRPHVIARKPIKEYVSVTSWTSSIEMTILLRDKLGRQDLCTAASIVFGSNFSKQTGEAALVGQFFEAVASEDPESAMKSANEVIVLHSSPSKERNVILLLVPQLLLWQDILRNDKGKAENSLKIALESHKQFWGTDELRQDKFGWISLPLLAACAYAYDHGMDINVESDYIPRWLVTGDFE